MPKKRHQSLYTKPSSTVHPALSKAASAAPRTGREATASSVNERLANLRLSQPPHREADEVTTAPTQPSRTLHPSLNGLFGVPLTPPPAPRRNGLGIARTGRGSGPAGPPPPLSWLLGSPPSQDYLEKSTRPLQNFTTPAVRCPLPGMTAPHDKSLLHMSLKALAKEWTWQAYYNQHLIATVPPRIKSILVSYLGVYGPVGVIRVDDLNAIFALPSEAPDAIGNDEITHLDLSRIIGHSLNFRELKTFLHPVVRISQAETDREDLSEDEPEWASFADHIPSHPSPLRFTNLTALSLSHPGPKASWTGLLSMSPRLATLTHLSLAAWPIPTRTPNSLTATTSSRFSPRVAYGGTDFYSAYDGAWSEAASLLRQLSRATYCLQWLDLDDCETWWDALRWEKEREGAEWTGAWRGMKTVLLRSTRTHSAQTASRSSVSVISPDQRDPVTRQADQVAEYVKHLRAREGLSYIRFERGTDI
ncbi:MAG: hypothetical protein M1825_004336 [Sarcosagium campestre]|nr:MAG: hypothetical protein M1825_004336 [Sarcosagium campestre]